MAVSLFILLPEFTMRKEHNNMKYLDMAIVAITGFCFGWLLKYIQDEKAEYSIYLSYFLGKPQEL